MKILNNNYDKKASKAIYNKTIRISNLKYMRESGHFYNDEYYSC